MIERDAKQLAESIRANFGATPDPADWIWSQCPAAKVIDCVLSLRMKYDSIVEPRVKKFVGQHGEVTSCADLRSMIDSFQTPTEFLKQTLDINSPNKASIISGVIDYLLDVQPRFNGATEDERLNAWAQWTRPGDYLALDIRGFKLAGFQYLRMLFGASTVKPDVHILRFAETVLGKKVSEGRAVYILERSAEILGTPARNIDIAIWERGARQK